jgi:small subunit ribosomal protein S6e
LPSFKIVLSDPKSSKSQIYELKDQQASALLGIKIGDIIDGSLISIKDKFRITGGSDKAGFPMRQDVLGGVKKYVLMSKGVGFRSSKKGEKSRKLVRGNTITEEIYQINAIIVNK